MGGCRVQLAANADIVPSRAEKNSNNNNNVSKEDPKLEGEGRRTKDSFGLIFRDPFKGNMGEARGLISGHPALFHGKEKSFHWETMQLKETWTARTSQEQMPRGR